jgi:hypothetical protein
MDWGMALPRLCKSIRGYGLLLLLMLLGCGQDEKLTPVRGHVFYHGQPLKGGTIVFTPDAERGGRGPLAWGEIEADGRYTLHTGDKPGVVSGWHRISIAPPSPSPASVELPRKYGDPEQSGLLREIQAGKLNEHDFYLQ